MSMFVLLEINVKTENASALEAMLASMLVDTRAFGGCISVEAIRNPEDPGNVVLVEHWRSRADQERYTAWRTDSGASSSAAAEISATYGYRFFDRMDV